MSAQHYLIGTLGQAWTQADKQQWFNAQSVKRSYADEVLAKLSHIDNCFTKVVYGELKVNDKQYPLQLFKSQSWDITKKNILITGGVHGYETSGVQGAIEFLNKDAASYLTTFNIVIVPCVSPWGYETINRWNPNALDPNRSFDLNSGCNESVLLIQAINQLNCEFTMHIDLHETTDTDNLEFRPALAARDGIKLDDWGIPDGFYLVGDVNRPQAEFQRAIIQQVSEVTHIAPSDADGKIIGELAKDEGIIYYDAKAAKLCMGLSDAEFVTTTEVYPDSAKATAEQCNQAQVAAIKGGLAFID